MRFGLGNGKRGEANPATLKRGGGGFNPRGGGKARGFVFLGIDGGGFPFRNRKQGALCF